MSIRLVCTNLPADDHEHCPEHGCVEYVCCIPSPVHQDAHLDSIERDTDADAPTIAFYAEDGIAYTSSGLDYVAWTVHGIIRNRYEA